MLGFSRGGGRGKEGGGKHAMFPAKGREARHSGEGDDESFNASTGGHGDGGSGGAASHRALIDEIEERVTRSIEGVMTRLIDERLLASGFRQNATNLVATAGVSRTRVNLSVAYQRESYLVCFRELYVEPRRRDRRHTRRRRGLRARAARKRAVRAGRGVGRR